MAKFIVWVTTDRVGSKTERTFHVPDEDLKDLSEQDRNALIEEYARDEMWQCIEWGWKHA